MLGVQAGWKIKSVNGAEMKDDATAIQQATGLCSYGLCSYGRCGYDLYNYDLYSYDLYTYGLHGLWDTIERDPAGNYNSNHNHIYNYIYIYYYGNAL